MRETNEYRFTPPAPSFVAGYNANDELTGDGIGTARVYDATGNHADGSGAVSQRTFDSGGRIASLTDAKNNVSRWTYDTQNRLSTQTNATGGTTTTTYDSAGRIATVTDASGRQRTRAYDAAGRTVSEAWTIDGGAADTLHFSYDSLGRVATAGNAQGTYSFAYDTAGRIAHVDEPFGVSLSFEYDPVGNRTKVSDSNGGVETSVYDAANRLTSRAYAGGTQAKLRVDYTYVGTSTEIATESRYGDLAGMYRVGQKTYTYDASGHITRLLQTNGSVTTLSDVAYSYDSAGRLATESSTNTTRSYRYDGYGQVINVSDATASGSMSASGEPQEAEQSGEIGTRSGEQSCENLGTDNRLRPPRFGRTQRQVSLPSRMPEHGPDGSQRVDAGRAAPRRVAVSPLAQNLEGQGCERRDPWSAANRSQ